MGDTIKVLSLNQPYPTLIAEGIKGVPMVEYADLPNVWPPEHGCIFHNPLGGLMHAPGNYQPVEVITDQLPYGDYAPGRHGLLLADVEPLAKPYAFKGGQGLSRSVDPLLFGASLLGQPQPQATQSNTAPGNPQ